MQQHEPLSVLLAVKPGQFRNALQNLLSTMQGFDVISLTGDLDAALTVAQIQRPAIVLVDIAMLQQEPNNTEQLIGAVGSKGGRCIVITENMRQQRLLETSGALRAVVRGTHPHELVEIIETILEGTQRSSSEPLTLPTQTPDQLT